MFNPEILNEQPINISDLKEELERIRKRDGELNYRANKTAEYLNLFTKIGFKQAKELAEKMEKLGIPRLKDIHIQKIIDLLPETVEDLKTILQGYTLTINNDNAKKVVDAVAPFVPKKKK